MKTYALKAEEMRPLAPGHGSCIASDTITVQGKKVGYMVRETPEPPYDSGWRFMSGEESQEYLDDPDNLAIYDVNTIANYSPDIVPLLDSPPGSAFARDDSGNLACVADPERDFIWRPESISAAVLRDDFHGLILDLDQELRPDEGGWTNMKISLPEHWCVESVRVIDERIVLTLADGRQYAVDRDNVGELSFQLMDGGPGKSAEIVERIWDRYARQASDA